MSNKFSIINSVLRQTLQDNGGSFIITHDYTKDILKFYKELYLFNDLQYVPMYELSPKVSNQLTDIFKGWGEIPTIINTTDILRTQRRADLLLFEFKEAGTGSNGLYIFVIKLKGLNDLWKEYVEEVEKNKPINILKNYFNKGSSV